MQGEFEESMVRTLWCFDACASRANGQDVDEEAAWWGVEFAVIDVQLRQSLGTQSRSIGTRREVFAALIELCAAAVQ